MSGLVGGLCIIMKPNPKKSPALMRKWCYKRTLHQWGSITVRLVLQVWTQYYTTYK